MKLNFLKQIHRWLIVLLRARAWDWRCRRRASQRRGIMKKWASSDIQRALSHPMGNLKRMC